MKRFPNQTSETYYGYSEDQYELLFMIFFFKTKVKDLSHLLNKELEFVFVTITLRTRMAITHAFQSFPVSFHPP